MLGSIIGDIVGSAYEFHNYRGKDFQPLFHAKAKFTDDSVCTIAIADALITDTDPTTALQSWCRRYWSNGGWGQRFAFWIGNDHPQPYGSWGNGAAMRIAPVALLAGTEAELERDVERVSAITHSHPEALSAATAVALAVFWARRRMPAAEIATRLQVRFGYPLTTTTPDTIRPTYERTERARDSVPQALVCALHSCDFEDALRNAVSIGGDSDTIAAIAGGIAEAMHGIPETLAAQGTAYLPADMRAVLHQLYDTATRSAASSPSGR